MGDDLQLFHHGSAVDIGVVFKDGQLAHVGDPFGELIEDGGIRFQVDAAAGSEDTLIETHEFGMGQAAGCTRLPELGVGEGEPDRGDLVFGKVGGQLVDLGAEEGGVGEVGLKGIFGADIEAVAFDVDAEKVAVRVHFGQTGGVFALTAGELEGNGVFILEKGVPLAGHAFGVLQDVREGFYRFEADEFLLTHKGQN